MTESTTTENAGFAVEGGSDCDHPEDGWRYLGHIGTARLYQCDACEGAIVKTNASAGETGP